MVLLQPKLNLRVTQKQILTPGLVQMVSVLALNKLELRDMITAEMVENPVLEEMELTVPSVEDVARREEERNRESAEEAPIIGEKKDPFDEIDFGSFFQEYLDPGYRSPESEFVEKPSFENFLSRPTTLIDHLMWQLGSLMNVKPEVREAAELVIGNLNEDGYLTATDEELLGVAVPVENSEAKVVTHERTETSSLAGAESTDFATSADGLSINTTSAESAATPLAATEPVAEPAVLPTVVPSRNGEPRQPLFTHEVLQEAIELVRQMDPPGVACRDLRECLLHQLRYHQELHRQGANGNGTAEVLTDAVAIVDSHLQQVQNKQYKEIAKAMARPLDAVMRAVDLIRSLDPRPGLRYNKVEPRLIVPDVAFVKQGDEWLIIFNDDDVPQLRLNQSYKRLLGRDAAEKDVRNYVKERYKSAMQLIKNIEQRKQTILKVCQTIINRQRDLLEFGVEHLKPMMIKEVAEEIGVHPSTVSRAVANKYVHTPQGVLELRFFFTESVNGPEGGNTSLFVLKQRVKKLIEEEDPARPLTDEQITRILQSQGIQVTRRTVAKYREDMKIPSTHQRRVKD